MKRTFIPLLCILYSSLGYGSSQPGLQSYNGFNYWNVGPYDSVFGDELVGQRYDWISVNFQYGISTSDVIITTAGSGSTQSVNSFAVVSTGSTANSSSLIQSDQDIVYNAAHEAHALFSCIFLNGATAGTTQWIGVFNSVDGMAIGFNGTQFSILYRNNSVDTIIPSSSFNADRLDGTGLSGFVYDPTKVNIFRIAYGWLSSSNILFQVLAPNGVFITFHILSLMNTSTTPSLANPSLPMSMQVLNNNTTNNLAIGSASWSGSSVQKKSVANVRGRRVFYNGTYTVAANGETMLFAIRNNTTFNGMQNAIMDYFQTFQITPYTTTPTIILLFLRKNPTISNANFNTPFPESPNVLTSSGTITNGGTLLAVLPFSYYTANETLFPVASADKGAPIILNPGDILSCSIQNLSGSTSIGLIIEVSFQEIR